MSKFSRFLAIAMLVVVIVAALPLVLLAVAPMTVAGLIERYARSEIGIDLSVQDLAVTLVPLDVAVSGLALRNPDPAFEEPLLAADRLRLRVSLARYMDGAPNWWRGAGQGIYVRVERDVEGNTNWDVIDDDEPPEPARENALLQFDAVRIEDLTLLVIDRQEQHRFDVARLRLDKDVHERLAVDLQGRYGNEPLLASGTLALPHPLRANPVSFHAEALGGEILARGVVGHDGLTPGVAEFRVAFEDLSTVGALLGEDLQALEPLLLEGRLGAPEAGHWQLGIEGELAGDALAATASLVEPDATRDGEVAVDARAFGGRIELDAVLQDYSVPREARYRLAFEELSGVAALLGTELAGFQPVDLQGEVSMPESNGWRITSQGRLAGQPLDLTAAAAWRDDRYRLDDLDLTFGDSSLRARGELALDEPLVQARLRAERIDVDRWLQLLPAAEPDDPLALHEIAAALPIDALERWAVDVTGRVERLDVAGIRFSGIDFGVDGRDAALRLDLRLAAARGDTGDGQAWQLVEPLRLAGRLTAAERDRQVPGVEARWATAGSSGVIVTILPIAEDDPISFQIQGSVTGTEAVEGFEVARFEPLLPFEIDAGAVRDGTAWRLDPLDLIVSGEPATGRLLVDPAAEPMVVRGDLHARAIDLRRLVDVPEVAEEVELEAEEAEAREVPLFADDPLDWSWLDAATVDLRARVDRLTIQPLTLRDVRVQVRQRDGVLIVDPLDARLLDGELRSRLRARRRDGGGELDVRLLARGLAPADLGVADETVRGGASSLFVDLQARGGSARDLATSLNGELAVEVRETVVTNATIDMLGADVVAEAIRFIIPMFEREERTELRCAAVHALAVDGVLVSSEHIVMETDEVKVRASALVDLEEETLEIDFEPEAQEGVDIGVADVADLVQVRGTITDPSVEADPEGVLGAVASAGAAIVTAGASLLVQALLEDDDNGTPCRAVFAAEPADHGIEPDEIP